MESVSNFFRKVFDKNSLSKKQEDETENVNSGTNCALLDTDEKTVDKSVLIPSQAEDSFGENLNETYVENIENYRPRPSIIVGFDPIYEKSDNTKSEDTSSLLDLLQKPAQEEKKIGTDVSLEQTLVGLDSSIPVLSEPICKQQESSSNVDITRHSSQPEDFVDPNTAEENQYKSSSLDGTFSSKKRFITPRVASLRESLGSDLIESDESFETTFYSIQNQSVTDESVVISTEGELTSTEKTSNLDDLFEQFAYRFRIDSNGEELTNTKSAGDKFTVSDTIAPKDESAVSEFNTCKSLTPEDSISAEVSQPDPSSNYSEADDADLRNATVDPIDDSSDPLDILYANLDYFAIINSLLRPPVEESPISESDDAVEESGINVSDSATGKLHPVNNSNAVLSDADLTTCCIPSVPAERAKPLEASESVDLVYKAVTSSGLVELERKSVTLLIDDPLVLSSDPENWETKKADYITKVVGKNLSEPACIESEDCSDVPETVLEAIVKNKLIISIEKPESPKSLETDLCTTAKLDSESNSEIFEPEVEFTQRDHRVEPELDVTKLELVDKTASEVYESASGFAELKLELIQPDIKVPELESELAELQLVDKTYSEIAEFGSRVREFELIQPTIKVSEQGVEPAKSELKVDKPCLEAAKSEITDSHQLDLEYVESVSQSTQIYESETQIDKTIDPNRTSEIEELHKSVGSPLIKSLDERHITIDELVNCGESELAKVVYTDQDIALCENKTEMSNTSHDQASIAERLSSGGNVSAGGDVINHNLFSKQLNISGDKDSANETFRFDNRHSVDERDRRELVDQLASTEMDCEKYKNQVIDLKKELKTCRQKTQTLESELADSKRRENELAILVEEYGNKAERSVNTSGTIDDELIALRSSESSLKDQVKELKNIIQQHETNLKEAQKKEGKLNEQLIQARTGTNSKYEETVATLNVEIERVKKERDTAQMHLDNVEAAFTDVHQKYENLKMLLQSSKNIEISLRQDIAVNEDTIQKQDQKYEALKSFAMGQVEKYNQEFKAIKNKYEAEIARITAQMKRYEIKSNSLAEALQQKTKECEQLSAVCDEMLGKV